MNKNPKLTVLPQEEELAPSKISQALASWLDRWGKTASYILFGTIAVVSLGSIYFSKSPVEIQQASLSIEKELQNPTLEAGSLATIEKTLYAHPELAPLYEGKIAQTLLSNGNVDRLKNFTNPLFQRTSSYSYPLFHQYTENTLLIAQGNYLEAYNSSKNLQAGLVNEMETALVPSSYDLLLAWNLVRIAQLEEKLSLPEATDTWKKVLAIHQGKGSDLPSRKSLEVVENVYQSGNNNLISYIESIVK